MDAVFLSGLQFAITITGYALVLLIILLRICLKKDSAPVRLTCVFHPLQGETDSTGGESSSHPEHPPAQSEKRKQVTTNETQSANENYRNLPTSPVTFVLVVVVVIVIIATSVMLVFSSFVTTKPIPSITTQHITSNQQTISVPPEKELMTVKSNAPSPNDAPADVPAKK